MEQNGQENWHDPDYWRDKYAPKQHSAEYWRKKYAPKQHSASYWKRLYEGNRGSLKDSLHNADRIARKILYYVAWGLCLYKWYQYFTGR